MLKSNTQWDDTFKMFFGVYTKVVSKSECENIRKCCIYATYKGQEIKIEKINTHTNQFQVFTPSAYMYTDEFIQVVLGGKKSKDLYVWCDENIFDEFNLITTLDLKGGTITKRLITKDQAKEYIILLEF